MKTKQFAQAKEAILYLEAKELPGYANAVRELFKEIGRLKRAAIAEGKAGRIWMDRYYEATGLG